MRRQLISIFAIALCLVWLVPPGLPAQQAAAKPATQNAARPAQQGSIMTIHRSVETVLVNLSAVDSKGNAVKDLKPEEVQILEDGKQQSIASFEFENVDNDTGLKTADAAAADTGPSGFVVAGSAPKPAAPAAVKPPDPKPEDQYKDRRLMVLYFDLTTMQPEDVQNAVESAQNFVAKQMLPADLVAVVTLGNSLTLNVDFTADKDALAKELKQLNPATSSGFEAGGDGTTDGTADDGNSFAVDDTEFNIANADRSLEAVQSLCDMMAPIQQKKSVLYFSSGIQRSGTDNEITVRSAINACVKANVALNTMDARGLQPNVPGGNATAGSTRGSGAFNGSSVSSALSSNFSQQETISTLATETGGRTFLDVNNFAPVYAQVQKDTQAYYLVGYHSSNPAKDGKYRKIAVKILRPGVNAVSPKPGYYANKDINHLSTTDRQSQLQDELNSDVADHSLDLYLSDGYIRLDSKRYFVPVSVILPGNEIPLHGVNPKATPEVDFAGVVYDEAHRQLDHVGETVSLDQKTTGGTAEQISSKNLQYDTGFILAPGQKYQIRFAARENQTGQMGAFETVINIPDLDAQETKSASALSVSSIMVGSQLTSARPDPNNPMTETGNRLVASVSKVFTVNQHFYVYYEVYDPKVSASNQIKLLTDVAFFHGKVKAFETQLVTTEEITDPHRKAAVVQLDIPLSSLKPGSYTCQVNAVDDTANRFAFDRFAVVIRGAAAAAPAGR